MNGLSRLSRLARIFLGGLKLLFGDYRLHNAVEAGVDAVVKPAEGGRLLFESRLPESHATVAAFGSDLIVPGIDLVIPAEKQHPNP